MRLKDKVVIVTGSTTGIGKAIAVRCVAEGAKVVVNGRDKKAGEEVIKKLGEGNAVLHIEDIANEGAPQRLVDVAVKTFGRLDCVINNAAMIVSSDIESTDAAFLRKVIEVNTVAPFMLIKAALPHLAKTRGNALNIGSVNAYCGEPNLLAYSISKGALMTMSRNLGDAIFRHYGVRVNQLNPGWVLTETETVRKREHGLADDWYKDLPKVYAPAGRLLAPEEIAAAVVFWIGDESGPVSGQITNLEQYPFIGRNPPKDPETIKNPF